VLDEIKIQPLFAKPLAFTKISIHESDIQIIKDLEYKQIEPDGFQSVDDMIWDRLPDLTRDIEHQVKAFNDNVMFYQTPIKMTRMWGTKFLPGQQGEYNIFNMKSFDMPVERGTLLIFKSSLPHKVMKTNNERYSVAGNFIVTDLKDFNIV